MAGESLIRQVVFAENACELTRQELAEVAQKGDYDEIARIADRLGDELKALSSLRERAAASSFRNLAKEIAAQLLRMAKTERPSARAIATVEPLKENEEADHHAARQFN
jgi:hypothetical protein